MKKYIINKCLRYIKHNTNYNDVKMSEIKYGLEGIYLTITKIVIIFAIAFILDIFNEVIIFLLIYNILRLPSFGLHATKSWICLVSSSIIFIGIPYLCLLFKIPIIFRSIISSVGILLMFKNAPADTYKRPIVSKKRRNKLKFISTIFTIIYGFCTIFIKSDFISNCYLFSIILQNCMIAPTTYKLFKLPYNNYINYIKTHPNLLLD